MVQLLLLYGAKYFFEIFQLRLYYNNYLFSPAAVQLSDKFINY